MYFFLSVRGVYLKSVQSVEKCLSVNFLLRQTLPESFKKMSDSSESQKRFPRRFGRAIMFYCLIYEQTITG